MSSEGGSKRSRKKQAKKTCRKSTVGTFGEKKVPYKKRWTMGTARRNYCSSDDKVSNEHVQSTHGQPTKLNIEDTALERIRQILRMDNQ